MWLFLRLVVSGIIGALRAHWRSKAIDGTYPWRGEIVLTRKASTDTVYLGLAFHHERHFELSREHTSDRLLKSLGLLKEQQTGDRTFDAQIFIRSDDLRVGSLLQGSPRLRTSIGKLFAAGTIRLVGDEEHLWIEVPEAITGKDEMLTQLGETRSILGEISAQPAEWSPEGSMTRVALAEALIWGLTAYAVTGLFDLLELRKVAHDWSDLWRYSVLAWVGLGACSVSSIVLLVRRSSWAKKIYWEAGVLLGIALPFGAVTFVSDLNRALPTDPARTDRYAVVERQISNYSKMVRGRGVEIITDYLVRVEPQEKGPPAIPRLLPVSQDIYEDPSSQLDVEWLPGALGIPVVISITAESKPIIVPRVMRYDNARLAIGAVIILIVFMVAALSAYDPAARRK